MQDPSLVDVVVALGGRRNAGQEAVEVGQGNRAKLNRQVSALVELAADLLEAFLDQLAQILLGVVLAVGHGRSVFLVVGQAVRGADPGTAQGSKRQVAAVVVVGTRLGVADLENVGRRRVRRGKVKRVDQVRHVLTAPFRNGLGLDVVAVRLGPFLDKHDV